MRKTIGRIGVLMCILGGIWGNSGCTSSRQFHGKNIPDMDTLYLTRSNGGISVLYNISGAVYKAIDPRYIANQYRDEFMHETGDIIKDQFELMNLTECSEPVEGRTLFTTLNAADSWNYYINGKLMYHYSRILAFTLMPRAIEKIEYIPSDTLKKIYLDTELPKKAENGAGAVHILTRDLSKVTPESKTLYLLDDTVVTRKIFDAVNPVCIKSLRRITDKEELARYGRKGLEEVVEVKFFTLFEIAFLISTGGSRSVLLVDGIQLHPDMYSKLNKYFFRSVSQITEESRASIPYKEKYPGKETFHIIILH